MDSLFNALKSFCLRYDFDRTYYLGLSGGLDSTVLLHLLIQLRSLYPLKLHAIHVHHGLSPNADSWVMHCKKMCDEFAVEFTHKKIDVKSTSGQSQEEVARLRRYEIFSTYIDVNDMLLTAHHQDDQAETVLLQLLRGAGPKGLAAMSRCKPFKKGFHARPLLNFTRQELHLYAEANQLQWINDESNANINFTRNFIRHQMISLLASRWPNIVKTLARVADHCAEAQELLENFSQQDLTMCLGSKPNTVSVKKLLQLNPARQRQVLRLWFTQLNFPIPSTIKMRHIMQDVLHARSDKLPHVIWGDAEVRRYRDDLYVMHCLSQHHDEKDFIWNLQEPFIIPNKGTLRFSGNKLQTVTVRFRQGGENMRLLQHGHHHSLKKLFQKWGVLPWQRNRIPCIFVEDELIAVVGYFIAEEWGEKGWKFEWEPQ